MNDQDRFLEKVQITDGCWLWTRSTNKKGYGTFWFNGRCQYAHRVSYQMFVGPLLPRQPVDHKNCFIHRCVRPDHLRPATVKQNAENRQGAQANNLSTGVRGVYRAPSGRWLAIVTHHQKQHYLGRFDSLEEAESAAVAKRLELFTFNEIDKAGARE